jgi:hypothetical protein
MAASHTHILLEIIPFKYPFGKITALVGDKEIFQETLTRMSGREVLKIPLQEASKFNGEYPAILTIKFTDGQTSLGTPDEIKDGRQLGIGILTLKLIN